MYRDLARQIDDRQPVGFHPQISVMSTEKRFQWIMRILSSKDSPLGCVEDHVWKEHQKRGAVHWHMLFWVKQSWPRFLDYPKSKTTTFRM